jgi:hypothetical protein
MFASAAVLVTATLAPSAAPADIDAAFKAFWAARTPQEAARVVPDLLRSGVTLDEALKRLKAGRPYSTVRKGIVKASDKTHGKQRLDHAVRGGIADQAADAVSGQ